MDWKVYRGLDLEPNQVVAIGVPCFTGGYAEAVAKSTEWRRAHWWTMIVLRGQTELDGRWLPPGEPVTTDDIMVLPTPLRNVAEQWGSIA